MGEIRYINSIYQNNGGKLIDKMENNLSLAFCPSNVLHQNKIMFLLMEIYS